MRSRFFALYKGKTGITTQLEKTEGTFASKSKTEDSIWPLTHNYRWQWNLTRTWLIQTLTGHRHKMLYKMIQSSLLINWLIHSTIFLTTCHVKGTEPGTVGQLTFNSLSSKKPCNIREDKMCTLTNSPARWRKWPSKSAEAGHQAALWGTECGWHTNS